jgi:RNA polymerase sigma-70 factor (ECF subfamily)
MPPDAKVSPEDSGGQRFLRYVTSGDKGILQALIEEYADRSYNQARRIIGRTEGADDVVQESLLLLVTTASRFDGSVPFAAWLGRIVTSTSINYRRRMHRQKILSGQQGALVMHEPATPSENVDRPELDAVRTALDSLPDRYRTPLTMHYLSGLSQAETAQAMGVPSVTIRSLLARGLERLRNKLDRAGFAVTSAGLLTMFSNIPSYAAPPALKASLLSAASERFVAASRHVGQHIFESKGASTLLTGAGLIKAAAIAVVAATGAVLFVPQSGLTTPTAPSQVDLRKGLVGYWNLDEYPARDGSRVIDSSNNGNHGLLVADNRDENKSITGKFGRAVSFGGADYITLGQPESLLFTGAMTVACWARFHDLNSNYRLVSKQGKTLASRSWDLCLENLNPDVFGFQISVDGTYEHDVAIQAKPADGPIVDVWTHIAAVYEPGTAMRIYKDGVMIAEDTQGIPALQYVANGTDILIGADSRWAENEMFGAIDEVRIYNRALSGAEMAYLAQFAPVQ